ncbi:MAG: 23S rRNA (guanosine(2251)-2'-O)-methyltransferase RlmB [Terriglobia bacterium]
MKLTPRGHRRPPEPRDDVIYGINAVKEAIEARPVEYVLFSEGHHGGRLQELIDGCRAHGISVRFAPVNALGRLAGTVQHQHAVAVVSARSYESLESLLESTSPALIVALDGVEDPGNLGAVVRTAVGAGATGAVIPERRAAGLTPAVARAAAGALEHLRMARVPNLTRTLADLKKQNIWVYGFEPKAQKSYLDLDYRIPCVLVLGGEGQGLHRLVRETCDELAHLPLYGPVESLNVSVAAGIVLYEAARQRQDAKKQVTSDR